jgi:hypothetical protein
MLCSNRVDSHRELTVVNRAAARRGGAVIACCTAGLAGVAALALTGCSGSGTPAATPASSSAVTAVSTPAATTPPLDAKSLNALLLPRGDMPAGYTADKTTTIYDNHALPEDQPTAVPRSKACMILTQTAWIRAAGIITDDFAQAGYASPSRTAGVAEEIDAFDGGDAKTAMNALWRAFASCKSFSQSFGTQTAATTLTRSVLHGKWPGIKAVEVSPKFEGGVTLAAVRVGYAVVTVLDSSTGSDEGAAAVSLADRIADRLSAAEKG